MELLSCLICRKGPKPYMLSSIFLAENRRRVECLLFSRSGKRSFSLSPKTTPSGLRVSGASLCSCKTTDWSGIAPELIARTSGSWFFPCTLFYRLSRHTSTDPSEKVALILILFSMVSLSTAVCSFACISLGGLITVGG